MRKAVQLGEHGRIYGKPDKANFLSASGLQPIFSQLVGKTEFAAGEKEQTPGMGFAQIALAAGAPLALTVGQHVGAFGQNLAVDLPDFIQTQHIVVVQNGDILKAVVRGAQLRTCSGPPQTEAAICKAVVLPEELPPSNENPPPSRPARRSSGPAKATHRAKLRRELPTESAAISFQPSRVPAVRYSSP